MTRPRTALSALLAAAVFGGCAVGSSVSRHALFAEAPPDVPVQVVTLEVRGRRATYFLDEEAELRLRKIPGVLRVGRGGGKNEVLVLTEASLSPEVLVMTLEEDFATHVLSVARDERGDVGSDK
jgi:hypothetical protein